MPVQTWSAAFQATPAGSDQVSEGDDRIRELKETIQAELEPEHDVGTIDAAYNDNGRHKLGSARAFFQSGSAAYPAALQKPDGTNEVDKTPPSGVGTLDNGRLYVDWDDVQPFVREQTQIGGNWTDLNTNEGANALCWVSLWERDWTDTDVANNNNQQNTAGAGTREGVDSAGGVGGVLGVSIDCPDDGRSYEISVTATCSYFVSTGETLGFWLVEDDGAANDRDAKLVYKEDANGTAGEVTLTYTQTSPTNGTTYEYTVEFTASVNGVNAVVNPDAAKVGVGAVGDFVGETSWSRISVNMKPRQIVGAGNYTKV